MSNKLAQAVKLHESGQLAEAESVYRDILSAEPENADALHLLGVLAYQNQKHDAAAALIDKALKIDPKNPVYLMNQGLALQGLGKVKEAATCFTNAVKLDPNNPQAHYNLASAQQILERPDQAMESCRRALALRPRYPEAYLVMGNALAAGDRQKEALEQYKKALELRPEYAAAQANLGRTCVHLGRTDEAVDYFRQAVGNDPGNRDHHFDLATVLNGTSRFVEAIKSFEAALSLVPDDLDSISGLSTAYRLSGRFKLAGRATRQALEIEPENVGLLGNMGMILRELGQIREGVEYTRRGLEQDPENAELYSNLGTLLTRQGEIKEAIACFRKSVEIKPENTGSHSNLLHTLYYDPGITPQDHLSEAQAWQAAHGIGAPRPTHSNDPDPERRLKIGYVSGDFRHHSVGFFAGSFLCSHDKENFEITCYANHRNDDALTERLKAAVDRWRNISSSNDRKVAATIQDDGIDILVDLSGHTALNRLPVFVMKPAPVQVTYLGYPGTTGLEAMDYRVTDHIADPEGEADPAYAETLARLDRPFVCFVPPPEAPEVSAAPVKDNGYITFGSFNNIAKVGPAVISVWSKILREMPTSRLFLKDVGYDDPKISARIREDFAAHGISSDRLELAGIAPLMTDHLNMYGRVDIALDTFPYNGVTTTCEAGWMGVPIIVMAGWHHSSRVGASLLTGLGQSNLIARDMDQYVSLAVELASDLAGLAHLRDNLRERMAKSPLTAAKSMGAALEEAYHKMWRTWCQAEKET